MIKIDENKKDNKKIPHLSLKKKKAKKSKMPVFECWCGSRILIVPDTVAMGNAIKNHIIVHKKVTGQRITEATLTQEVLKVLSKP
ncbi:MAG: hypothetical protein NWE98_06455 [Candidatus Bathyarchaeota archaeon]|nr:hypothetical protein [Candidatus Bathyarchaeota archaeon]